MMDNSEISKGARSLAKRSLLATILQGEKRSLLQGTEVGNVWMLMEKRRALLSGKSAKAECAVSINY